MIRRLFQLVRALVHRWFSRVESTGALAQLQVSDARRAFDAAENYLAQAIADERQLGLRVTQAIEARSGWHARAEAAICVKREDLARRALDGWFASDQEARRLEEERQAQADHVAALRLEFDRNRRGFEQDARTVVLLSAREHMATARGLLRPGGDARAVPQYERRVLALEARAELRGETTAKELDQITDAVEREATIEQELERIRASVRPKATA